MARKKTTRPGGRRASGRVAKSRAKDNLPHSFGRTRPSHSGIYPIHVQPERDTHFRPLPKPTGVSPFHLDIRSILPSADYQAIVKAKAMTFHLNGDMGGIKNGMDQQLVAKGMEQDTDPK